MMVLEGVGFELKGQRKGSWAMSLINFLGIQSI